MYHINHSNFALVFNIFFQCRVGHGITLACFISDVLYSKVSPTNLQCLLIVFRPKSMRKWGIQSVPELSSDKTPTLNTDNIFVAVICSGKTLTIIKAGADLSSKLHFVQYLCFYYIIHLLKYKPVSEPINK